MIKTVTIGYMKPVKLTINIKDLIKKDPKWKKWAKIYCKDFFLRTDEEEEFLDENGPYEIANLFDNEAYLTEYDDCEVLDYTE